MGGWGIADDARERNEHQRATAAAILAVYCLSAALAGVGVAMAVLRVIAFVDPFR